MELAGARAPYWNLAVCWLGCMLGATIVVSATFGVFFGSLAGEFHWSRGEISLAYSVFLCASLLGLPLIGRLVDRHGARKVVVGGVLLFGLGLSCLRFAGPHLWQLYGIFAAIGLIAGATSTVPYFKVLARSFQRRRGMAFGLANSGSALGTVGLPIIAHALIDATGWRNAYSTLGASISIVTALAVLVGLAEAGAPPAQTDAPAGSSLRAALQQPGFWFLGGVFFIATTGLIGFLIHIVPLLEDRGVSPRAATLAVSTFGAAQLVGRIVVGLLLDRFAPARVAAAAWLVAAVCFYLIFLGVSGPALLVCAALIGFTWGGEGDVLAYSVGRMFGIAAFGEIYGALLMLSLFGGVVGPYFLGLTFDLSGSYSIALATLTSLLLVAAALILRVRFPDAR